MIEIHSDAGLPWTGERYLPQVDGAIELEHYHRYSLVLKACANKKVLDIASGEGYGSHLISSVASEVIGVDVSQEAVQHATQKYTSQNLGFVCGSADSIPFPDGYFDVIISFETIEHHDKHDESIAEYKRVLNPAGNLIISSPNKLNYSDKVGYSNHYHILELYREELIALIGKYFKNYEAYGQKVVMCSLIVNESGNGLEHWKDKSLTESFEPVYDLLVAGDSELYSFKNSFFELTHSTGVDYVSYMQKIEVENFELSKKLEAEKMNASLQIVHRDELIKDLHSRLQRPLVRFVDKICHLLGL